MYWPPIPGSRLYMLSLNLNLDLIRGFGHLYKTIIGIQSHMSQVPGVSVSQGFRGGRYLCRKEKRRRTLLSTYCVPGPVLDVI